MLKNSFFCDFSVVWKRPKAASFYEERRLHPPQSPAPLTPISSTLHSNLQHPSLTTLSSTPHSLHSPAPFNHSTLQHPSITHLSSTLQSLTSPAPFNPLRFIFVDIVQTTMSISTLYLFPFSRYMQKTNMFSVHAQLSFRNTVRAAG